MALARTDLHQQVLLVERVPKFDERISVVYSIVIRLNSTGFA